jgi:hypothetical protein
VFFRDTWTTTGEKEFKMMSESRLNQEKDHHSSIKIQDSLNQDSSTSPSGQNEEEEEEEELTSPWK